MNSCRRSWCRGRHERSHRAAAIPAGQESPGPRAAPLSAEACGQGAVVRRDDGRHDLRAARRGHRARTARPDRRAASGFPEAAAVFEEAAADLVTFTGFPKEHGRQVWRNNSLERLNKETRRRIDVVGIFPERRSSSRRPARRATRRMGPSSRLHERRVDRQDAHRSRRRA